ncbi:phosphodiester glycosidase family protein [Acinetobacter puyangensis]|uniref:Uncharacterized protein YigE, DUF2233 family n=1 Tax=Acinetobacter puyangensis TaxID=1096779 RepID=A0A240EEZ4_9GAMM|nr:phosphodiester glycosidase family protein [Acinetobacter puyangensis]SNX46500.1 Uncharacterized protein YigE, DUF2233 family [Acinetobacter puyangensis]
MRSYRFLISILCLISAIVLSGGTQAHAAIQHDHFQQQSYTVYQLSDLSQLRLALYDGKQRPLSSFAAWQQQLKSCEQLDFAMNAGMFHAGFSPVGLYIEKQQQLNPLNQSTGFGNFFLKPNGVLAWNQQEAVILTSEQWQAQHFNADYATQSGPMLVIDGKIHPQFIVDSSSKKIRNGVGLKDGTLYFVISDERVSFYQFAQFFKTGLGIDQALYLDGTISSLYSPHLKHTTQRAKLGPMLGVVQSHCK